MHLWYDYMMHPFSRSDLDLLAVASEQRRKEFIETEKVSQKAREFEDENTAPLNQAVKMVRMSSGTVIVKPEPKKVFLGCVLCFPDFFV